MIKQVGEELKLEDFYEEVKAHRNDTTGLYGVLNKIAKVEKEKLGIKEWSDLNLEQWEEMLGRPDDWMAHDLQKADGKYVDDVTGLPLEDEHVRKARGQEIRNFCTKGAELGRDILDRRPF